MPRSDDLYTLPPNLPVPIDDGACDHLRNATVPSIALASTGGERVDLSRLPGRTIVYCYPKTGRPGQDAPSGWDQVPGARGCTPQSCGFRDRFAPIRERGARVFGMSTQSTEYQREAVERLHLPFALLSDADFVLTRAMRLPSVEIAGELLLRRMTLVLRDGRVEHLFYPVFPPDRDAEQVLAWLEANPVAAGTRRATAHDSWEHAAPESESEEG